MATEKVMGSSQATARLGMPAWTALDGDDIQQGMIHRVNREDEHGLVTYDSWLPRVVPCRSYPCCLSSLERLEAIVSRMAATLLLGWRPSLVVHFRSYQSMLPFLSSRDLSSLERH